MAGFSSARLRASRFRFASLADIHEASGASFIYRENNSRYIGVQYSIEDRDLQSAVTEGQRATADIEKSLPPGYRLAWGGEYSEYLEAKQQIEIIGPLALLLIFMILFALYGNFKFPLAIALGVVITEPVGALIALKLTHTPFSVSSALGLLALMGVSVETAVILVSFINKLRLEGKDIRTATREAALMRLRPIMMTALVACLGLLPAALSSGIGSDTQKPFRHRHRCGIGFAALYRDICRPGTLPRGRKRWRRFAGLRYDQATR